VLKQLNDVNWQDVKAGRFLGEWLINSNPLHVDLSFNGLSSFDCDMIGKHIFNNYTLLGVHLRGNEA
jgi:hypothetical protein